MSGHKLATVETDDLFRDLIAYTKWLDEEAGPSELKPCPFCNGKNIKVYPVPNFEKATFRVKCNDCGCSYLELFDKEEDAIRAWNTRS